MSPSNLWVELKRWAREAAHPIYRRMPPTVQTLVRTSLRPPDYRSSIDNLYHCTTQKAASQTIRGLLGDRRVYDYCGLSPLDYEESLPGGVDLTPINRKVISTAFPKRRILTPLYVGYEPYRRLPKLGTARAFFVMRDPRDLLVSEYFSVKFSHAPMGDIPAKRTQLLSTSEEDGLQFTLADLQQYGTFDCQRSWHAGAKDDRDVIVVRYEDLLSGTNTVETWTELFRHADVRVPPQVLEQLLRDHSFQSQANREPGKEDVKSHLRKGMPGDWRNHFSPKLKDEFKRITSDLVVALGYESSSDW